MPGAAVKSGSRRGEWTRFTVSAAARSRATRWSAGTPVRSRPLTSPWLASHGMISAWSPVSRLTTPAGTSLVASTSANVTATVGSACDATTTAVLPPASTDSTALTRGSRGDADDAATATTPVGSGAE